MIVRCAMRLNLKDIIHMPGTSLPFEFELDLSQLEFSGERALPEPVLVSGQVRNRASALVLEGLVQTTLHLPCDRCLESIVREKVVSIDTLLATELAYEANEDEIYLLEGDELDLEEVATTAIVLSMDAKHLCHEDCLGICYGCGVDLNHHDCTCKPEVDPRLAGLATLLEGQNSE